MDLNQANFEIPPKIFLNCVVNYLWGYHTIAEIWLETPNYVIDAQWRRKEKKMRLWRNVAIVFVHKSLKIKENFNFPQTTNFVTHQK